MGARSQDEGIDARVTAFSQVKEQRWRMTRSAFLAFHSKGHTMHTSDRGRAFIGVREGLRLRAYCDSIGVWTIGYGHTSMAGAPAVRAGMVITRATADAILTTDLLKYEAEVLAEVKVPLAQCQFDALVSFTYNCGEGSLRKAILLAHLNSGNVAAVPHVMLEFERAGGRVMPNLMRRRKAEAAMFQGRYPLILATKIADAARAFLQVAAINKPVDL